MQQNYTLLLSVLFFLCTSFTTLLAGDHYWVGGSGNWTDISHWASTSGGVGGSISPQVVPSPFDDVFFDANSGFTAGNNTVTIDDPDIFCRNMDWTGAANSPNFVSPQGVNSDFNIYGSLTFIPNMTFQFDGMLNFLSTSAGNTITTGGQHFSSFMIFNGISGSWILQDSLSVNDFKLVEGSFYGNGKPIRAGDFGAFALSTTMDTLDLSQSNIYLYKDGGIFKIQADISNIFATAHRALTTNFDNANFYYTYNSTSGLSADRLLYLDLLDTTYINKVHFLQPPSAIYPQAALRYDVLKATGKVYINDVKMYNKSKILHAQDNPLTSNLIHINRVETFNNASYPVNGFPYKDLISDCECDYVKVGKGLSGVFSGDYGDVFFAGKAHLANGYFDNVVATEHIQIYTAPPASDANFGGTIIGNADVQKDGIFKQDEGGYLLQFDTLSLTENYLYWFKDTLTFTQNGWLNAVGNCDEPIFFKSLTYGDHFTFNAFCDTIQIEYTVLEYSQAVGNADFIALNATDKEGNLGWNFIPPASRTLYWVGGDGNWDNHQHWSLSSGGSGGECKPTLYDDVFFDANSGFTPNDSVKINVPIAYCRSMNWTGVTNSPTFYAANGHDTYIHGSLIFVPNMVLNYLGTVWFSSTSDGNTVTTSSLHFEKEIKFQGGGGSWSLMDSLSTENFKLVEGDFYSNGNSIRVGNFSATNSLVTMDTLDLFNCNIYPFLDNSTFKIFSDTTEYNTRLRTNLNNTNFHFTEATTSGRTLDLRLTDTAYINTVLFDGPVLGGSASTDKVKGNGTVYIDYVEIRMIGFVSHSDIPSTMDLIHIDTLWMLGDGENKVESCECNYTEIEVIGIVNSGLYNIVIIKDDGEIFNGYFNNVCIGDEAEVYSEQVGGIRADDFMGTFIGYANLKGDGYLYQNVLTYPVQFDTLVFSPGNLYEFEDTMTFTQNGWLDAVGLCDLPITMKAFNENIPFIINGLCDTIQTRYCILENSTAVGNAYFVGYDATDNGGNTGWVLHSPLPRTLYWVGGGGNWSDSQHWSLTSGGTPGECMPTLFDDVFFDANSGFAVNQLVKVDILLAYCKNMDWTGALNNPTFYSSQPSTGIFFINGSVKFIQNMNINFSVTSTIEFVSPINGNTITSAGQHFDNKVLFKGDGNWTLTDSLSGYWFQLKEGDFYSNANSIHARFFFASDTSSTLDTLDLFNSNIYIYEVNGKFDVHAATTGTSINHLYTNLNNTNFYFTSLLSTSTNSSVGRNLFLVLSDTAYINEVIFSGTPQSYSVDNIGANSYVYINQVEMYNKGIIKSRYNQPSMTDLVHIDSIKMHNLSNLGINAIIGHCNADDVFIANKGRVYQGIYNTTNIYGEGQISDGFFNIVNINDDAIITSSYSNSFFPKTTIGKITLEENGFINGEIAPFIQPLEVDTIILRPGKVYEFQDTITITQFGWLDAIGTGSLPIIMRSQTPGTRGTVKSLTDSICINYIFMQDLDTAGTAVFYAGEISVDISNNHGWRFEDCCSSFELSELFLNHDTTICAGESVDMLVYYGQCDGCTFLWQDGDTSELRTVMPNLTTTYGVAATRQQGCYSTDTVRVNVIPFPMINLQNDTTVSDTSQSFIIYHQPQNGTWSGNGIASNGLFDPSAVGSGTYQFVYTTGNGNCITTDTVLMTVVSDGCSFTDIHFYNNGFDVSCNGGNDGTVHISTLVGTAPFTYLWSNGHTDSIANNLSAGMYDVTITDSSGCTVILNVTVTEPPLLVGTTTIISNYNGQAISFPGANDGAISISASGGISPYTYLWNNNATTTNIQNLGAGTYTVTITDANGCIDIQSVTLTEPTGYLSQVLILSNYNTYAVSCFNNNDGSAEVNVSGGTPPYTFLWNNGQTDTIATGLSAGMVTVTITDANNFSIIDTINLNSPTALSASVVLNTPISCHGFSDGNITAFATGSVPNYTYLWENNSTIDNRMNLGIGTYFVTVTDANGCTNSDSITLFEPSLLEVSITQDSIYNGFGISCNNANDGNVTATATGGTPSYTYNWNNGQLTASAINLNAGLQIVTATDANGCTVTDSILLTEPTILTSSIIINTNYNGFNISCNGENDGNATVTISGGTGTYTYLWSDGQTTATATNLTAGTFTVTATDANGCTIIDNVTLTEPTPFITSTSITSNFNGVAISCFGENDGSAIVNVSGGSGNYTYLWNNGQTTAIATNLTAGTHYVTITDVNGCTQSDSVTLNEPTQISTILNTTSPACDGSVNISAITTGGTGNYTYQWNTVLTDTLNTITNLFTGTYSVTISDANNCQTQALTTVTTLDTLTVSIGNDTTLCIGETVTFDATTPNTLSYQWQDGSINSTFTATTSGLYYVLITNNNGCSARDSVWVNYFDESLGSNLPIDTIICENTSWLMDATVPNGVNYEWQDGSSNPTFLAINAGFYSVTITNSDGCTVDFSTIVTTQNLPAEALFLPTDTIMCQGNPIILNATTPFATDYIWEGESAFYSQNLPHDSTFIVTYPGIYNVNISNYCGGFSQFVEVTEEDCGCYPYIPNAFTPNNDGRNDEFFVYANCLLQDFEINIYDRFGGRVFISNDINDGWDGTINGKNVLNGVYVYVVTFKALNEKGKLESQMLSGDVTILR